MKNLTECIFSWNLDSVFPAITTLPCSLTYIELCGVPNVCYKALQCIKNDCELNLSFYVKSTNERLFIPGAEPLKNIKTLKITDSSLTNEDLKTFPNVTNLVLNGDNPELTPKVLQHFPNLKELHVTTSWANKFIPENEIPNSITVFTNAAESPFYYSL